MNTLTNEDGKIVKKFYYGIWGNQIEIFKTQFEQSLVNIFPISISNFLEINTKGFTGHEHIEGSDIIHMNGRIYSHMLARFLQAAPMVQAPTNGQNFN